MTYIPSKYDSPAALRIINKYPNLKILFDRRYHYSEHNADYYRLFEKEFFNHLANNPADAKSFLEDKNVAQSSYIKMSKPDILPSDNKPSAIFVNGSYYIIKTKELNHQGDALEVVIHNNETSFSFITNKFNGIIISQVSFDHGKTWTTIPFNSGQNVEEHKISAIEYSGHESYNGQQYFTIAAPPQATNVRVKIESYIGGSVSATLSTKTTIENQSTSTLKNNLMPDDITYHEIKDVIKALVEETMSFDYMTKDRVANTPTTAHNQSNQSTILDEDLKELEAMLDNQGLHLIEDRNFLKELREMGREPSLDIPNTDTQQTSTLNLPSQEQIKDTQPMIDTHTNGWITTAEGDRKHYVNGELHMDGDQPAVLRASGSKLWYKGGQLHREGGKPALEGAKGTFKYAVHNKYHRLGGLPAISRVEGEYRQEWWEDGFIKSATKKDGTKEFYAPYCVDREHTILHREDGPAVVMPNGAHQYWINGELFSNLASWTQALANKPLKVQNKQASFAADDAVDTIRQETTTKATQQKEKSKTMNDKPAFTDIMKANAASAAYRVGATQTTNLIKGALLTMMRNKGTDEGALKGIKAFLDTEFGAAFISFAVGSGLHYVPHFSEDPRVARLGEEMRVNGMATAANEVIGEAMEHLLPALTQVLSKLPSVEEHASTTRLEEAKDSKLVEAAEETEEVKETRRMQA